MLLIVSRLLKHCLVSGFRHDVDEVCAVLGYDPRVAFPSRRTTYRSHLQGLSSPRTSCLLKMEGIGCPETSVRNYHCTLHHIPEERNSQFDCCHQRCYTG